MKKQPYSIGKFQTTPKIRQIPHGKRLLKRNFIKKRPNKAKKKPKLKSLSKLIKEADRLFSIHTRMKYADATGNVTCFTCSYTAPWKKLQNGHFVSRYYKSTRWEEKNCRPQCYTCNMWRKGMIPDFAANLKKEYGEGIVEQLFEQARQPITLSREFLEEKIRELKKIDVQIHQNTGT